MINPNLKRRHLFRDEDPTKFPWIRIRLRSAEKKNTDPDLAPTLKMKIIVLILCYRKYQGPDTVEKLMDPAGQKLTDPVPHSCIC